MPKHKSSSSAAIVAASRAAYRGEDPQTFLLERRTITPSLESIKERRERLAREKDLARRVAAAEKCVGDSED